MAVFLKDAAAISEFPDRILHQFRDFDNGYLHGSDSFLNEQQHPEDKRKLYKFVQTINAFIKSLKS